MVEEKKPQPKKPASKGTQKFLPISEIREGIVAVADGSLRVVLRTSAINFELKSDAEKEALVYAFSDVLNSLDFPIQIIIQSRRLELDDYLRKLSDKAAVEMNELIRMQILDYVDFVKRLITVANIMDKRFYVVVPYFPTTVKKPGFLDAILGTKPSTTIAPKEFEEGKIMLKRRAENIASGLGGLGIKSAQLSTQELVELFYNIYNPETALRQKIPSLAQVTAEVIEQIPEMEIG